MKHTFFTKIFASMAILLGLASVNFAMAPRAAALECAILPPSICKSAETETTDVKKTGIYLFLIWVLNIMTAGVGVAAVGALIYAGVLYASAGGGSEQIVKSKKIITDVVIGIVAYALMFLVINWLVPGGVIG